jgi:hypothetical protein
MNRSVPILLISIYLIICQDSVEAQVEEEPWSPVRWEEMDEAEALRYHELMDYEIRQVYLNRARVEHLLEIPGMGDQMAADIIAFRDTVGEFLTIYELLSVHGMTRDYLRQVHQWFNLAPHGGGVTATASLRWVSRKTVHGDVATESRQPYGSPHKVVFRYRSDYRNWSASVKGEKDAGEPFGGELRPEGFDFYSGWLRYQGQKTIRQVIVGDYRVASGHGLLCNQLFAAGNNASLLYQPLETRVARPHTSMDEYHFFRGVTATLRHGSLRLTVYGSAKPLDGNITKTDSITGKTLAVSSIQTSGIHAIPSEIRNRHAFAEYATGAGVRFGKREFQIAFHMLQIHYSASVEPQSTFANTHRFRGSQTGGYSLYASWFNHSFGFSLETALSDGRPAISQVFVVDGKSKSVVWISSRHIAPFYHAPYANTLSRASRVTGEKGVNIVWQYSPTFGNVFRSITDIGTILSTPNAPASGRSFATHTLESSRQQKQFHSLIRITRDAITETAFASNEDISTPKTHGATIRYSARGALTLKPVPHLTLVIRTDYRMKVADGTEEGWMVAAGAAASLFRKRLTITVRHALFHCDSYDMRIFSHEQDAPGAFGMQMHYGTGTRTYMLIRLKQGRHLSCWIKAGGTRFAKPDPLAVETRNRDIALQLNFTL